MGSVLSVTTGPAAGRSPRLEKPKKSHSHRHSARGTSARTSHQPFPAAPRKSRKHRPFLVVRAPASPRVRYLGRDRIARMRVLMRAIPGAWEALAVSFIEHGERSLRAIAGALRNNQVSVALEEAHGLRGSGGTIGAVRLAARCAALEEALAHGDRAAYAGLMSGLNTEWRRVTARLQALAES